jgi:cytochrome P450
VVEQYPVDPKDWAHNIFTAKFDDHARQRRVLGIAFSDKALREQEPLIQGIVGLLVDRLRGYSEKGETTNLVDLFHFTLFDLTGLLLFGKSFNCLVNGEYHPWVGIIFESFQLSMSVSAIRSYPLGRYLFTWLPKHLKDKEAEHKNYVVQAVGKRLESGVTETKDLVTLTLQDGDPKYSLSREELTETATLFIVAGRYVSCFSLRGYISVYELPC